MERRLVKSQHIRAKNSYWSVELLKVNRAERKLRVGVKSVDWQSVYYITELDRNALIEAGFRIQDEFEDWFALICDALSQSVSSSCEWSFEISGRMLTLVIIEQYHSQSKSYRITLNKEALSLESYVSLLREDCAVKENIIEQLKSENEQLKKQVSGLTAKKNKRDLSECVETDQVSESSNESMFHMSAAERAKLRRQRNESAKKEAKRRKKHQRNETTVNPVKKRILIKAEKWLESDIDVYGRLLSVEETRDIPYLFKEKEWVFKRCPHTGCLIYCQIMERQTRMYHLDGVDIPMKYYLCSSPGTSNRRRENWQCINENCILEAGPTIQIPNEEKIKANRKSAAHWLFLRLMREFFEIYDQSNGYIMSKSVAKHQNKASSIFWKEFRSALEKEDSAESQSVVKIRLPMYFQKYDDPDYKCLAKSVRVRSDIAPTANEIFQVLQSKLMSRVRSEKTKSSSQLEAYHIDWFNKVGSNKSMISKLKSDTERCFMFGFEFDRPNDQSVQTIDISFATTWDNLTRDDSTCFFGFRRMISIVKSVDMTSDDLFRLVYETCVRVLRSSTNERLMNEIAKIRCLELGKESIDHPLLDLRYQLTQDRKRIGMLKRSQNAQCKIDLNVSNWPQLEKENTNSVIIQGHLLVILFDTPMFQLYSSYV